MPPPRQGALEALLVSPWRRLDATGLPISASMATFPRAFKKAWPALPLASVRDAAFIESHAHDAVGHLDEVRAQNPMRCPLPGGVKVRDRAQLKTTCPAVNPHDEAPKMTMIGRNSKKLKHPRIQALLAAVQNSAPDGQVAELEGPGSYYARQVRVVVGRGSGGGCVEGDCR